MVLVVMLACSAVAVQPQEAIGAAPAASVKKTGKPTAQKKPQAKATVAKEPAKPAAISKTAPAASSPATPRKAVRKAPRQDIKAAITMDMSRKRVLYQQNADKPIAPASLTKILSMFVILDEVEARRASLDSIVTVSHKAAATGGSCMNIYAGERVRLRDLLRGMAVASGNDASVAAAQHIAGSEDRFVQMMNRKAKQIGMKNSVFKNVHGLPAKGQQTTARDMLTLTTRYLAAHPHALEDYHSRRYLDFHGYTPNTNPLLGLMAGVDGLKTGYVGASGYNLITTAKRGDTRLVNVLLGAPNKSVRLQEASRMVQNGFETAEALAAKDAAAAAARAKAGKKGGKKKEPAPAAKRTVTATGKPVPHASLSRQTLP